MHVTVFFQDAFLQSEFLFVWNDWTILVAKKLEFSV